MKIHGVELIATEDQVINHQQKTGKPFESESIAAWLDAVQPLGTMVDVGAYSGLYAIAAAKSGVDVVAFEPNPAVFERLQANIEANRVEVDAFNCAVGAQPGTCGMELNRAVKLTSGGRVIDSGDIPMVTIDSLHLPFISAIKIDVEGHECQVIKGALETIKRCMPLIITEALEPEAELNQRALLEPLGYTVKPADELNLIWSPSVAC